MSSPSSACRLPSREHEVYFLFRQRRAAQGEAEPNRQGGEGVKHDYTPSVNYAGSQHEKMHIGRREAEDHRFAFFGYRAAVAAAKAQGADRRADVEQIIGSHQFSLQDGARQADGLAPRGR